MTVKCKGYEMNKEKHIDEIAKIINKPCLQVLNEAGVIGADCPFPYECGECMSRQLYNAGYRKQSDVIDDFVKRLLDAFPEPHRCGNLCHAIYYDDYREIIEECGAKMKGVSDE